MVVVEAYDDPRAGRHRWAPAPDAPRALLLLSASEDRYSADAPEIVQAAVGAWEAHGKREKPEHMRYDGGHTLTPERAEKIIEWVTEQANG